MARDYARIMTAIWTNQDFRNLREPEQRMYLLLVTQADISAAGVLPLRLPRWARMSSSSSPEALADVLKALEAGRFIVVDWDEGELLIRSFIRWDGGFNNPKRRPVIVRAAEEVVSPSISRHLVTEFARVGITPTEPPPDKPSGRKPRPPDRHADSLSGQGGSPTVTPLPQNPFPQVNSLSDRHAAEDGVVVTYLTTEDTTTHNPQPVPPAAGAAAPPDSPTAQTLVGEWIDQCRKRPPGATVGHMSKTIKQLLDEGIDPDDIRAGITTWTAKGLHPSALASVVNQHMNASRPPDWQRSSPNAPVDRITGWQSLKQTGTEGRPLFALPGGDPT